MAGIEGFGWYLQRFSAYFYAEDEILALVWATSLKREFDILADLFERMGLQTNVGKMVSMA